MILTSYSQTVRVRMSLLGIWSCHLISRIRLRQHIHVEDVKSTFLVHVGCPCLTAIKERAEDAGDHARSRQKVKWGVKQADSERGLKAADKRAHRKLSTASTTNTPTGFICSACSRDTATQDSAALQKPWTKPLLDTTGIIFWDNTLPANHNHSQTVVSINCR